MAKYQWQWRKWGKILNLNLFCFLRFPKLIQHVFEFGFIDSRAQKINPITELSIVLYKYIHEIVQMEKKENYITNDRKYKMKYAEQKYF